MRYASCLGVGGGLAVKWQKHFAHGAFLQTSTHLRNEEPSQASTQPSTHPKEEARDEGHLQREAGQEERPQTGNEVCVCVWMWMSVCVCVCMCAQGEPCTQCVLRVALTTESRSLQGNPIC